MVKMLRWDCSLHVRQNGQAIRASWLIEAPTGDQARSEARAKAISEGFDVVADMGCVEHPSGRDRRPRTALTDD